MAKLKNTILALTIGLSMALFAPGCGRDKGPPNFLFVTVDALRADHLGIYGYERDTSPNIDRYFSEGTVYERAYSTEANTSPSVVSFLTGLLPQENGIRLMLQMVPKEMMLVSDHLSAAGYQTAGIVSNTVLTEEAIDLNPHFDYYDDYITEPEPYRKVWERTAEPTTAAAVAWHMTAYDPLKPYFLWIHYQDPHGPYHPPRDKPVDFTHEEKEIISDKRVPAYQRQPGVKDGLVYVDLYDEEIAYMDHHVGKLLAFFEENDLLDNTVVIFSADHGESMMEHEQWFTHGYHVYEEITHVPLALHYPDQRKGKRVNTRVSLVDVTPTILNLARVDSLPEMRGQILGDSIKAQPVYGQGGDWRSMTYKDMKWLIEVSFKTLNVPTRRGVYDLAVDPKELSLLTWVRTPASEEFFKLIKSDPDPAGIPMEYADGMLIDAPKVRPDADEELLEKLRSLGYVK
jgi:arylsulfatase A-like enzyme